MRPGPTRITSCPHCSGFVAQTTLASRGRRSHDHALWTDGKPHDEPWTVYKTGQVCPHCRGWIDPSELKEVGTVPSWEDFTVAYPEARHLDAPNVEELLALAASRLTPLEERDVRLRAWWTDNDRRRTSADPFFVPHRPRQVPEVDLETGELVPSSWPPPGAGEAATAPVDPGPPLTEVEVANAHALLVSMDGPYTQDLVVRAEIMRRFGRFEEARAHVLQLAGHDLAPFRRFLLQLIAIRDRYVRMLPSE